MLGKIQPDSLPKLISRQRCKFGTPIFGPESSPFACPLASLLFHFLTFIFRIACLKGVTTFCILQVAVFKTLLPPPVAFSCSSCVRFPDECIQALSKNDRWIATEKCQQVLWHLKTNTARKMECAVDPA